ncbi:MAG TPA: hypothetical protein VLA19_33050 [Herpetosiphonaceae bacterium]|nr:hypothetical protein [Herpetosiphonaceae bacterium]
MPFHTVGITEETYKGWTVRYEHRAGYGYSWVAWKPPQQRLESYGGFLESREQSRHNARWAIDKHEAQAGNIDDH